MLMKSPGFREEYKENLIVTNGKNGIIYWENGENIFIKAPEVQAVDTMGKGRCSRRDAFFKRAETIHELGIQGGDS
jgi:hypothetical protein